jgi:hypothetical protein
MTFFKTPYRHLSFFKRFVVGMNFFKSAIVPISFFKTLLVGVSFFTRLTVLQGHYLLGFRSFSQNWTGFFSSPEGKRDTAIGRT